MYPGDLFNHETVVANDLGQLGGFVFLGVVVGEEFVAHDDFGERSVGGVEHE